MDRTHSVATGVIAGSIIAAIIGTHMTRNGHERHAHGAGRVAHHGRIRERPAPRQRGNDEQRDPAGQGLARVGVHALYATSAMKALDMP